MTEKENEPLDYSDPILFFSEDAAGVKGSFAVCSSNVGGEEPYTAGPGSWLASLSSSLPRTCRLPRISKMSSNTCYQPRSRASSRRTAC